MTRNTHFSNRFRVLTVGLVVLAVLLTTFAPALAAPSTQTTPPGPYDFPIELVNEDPGDILPFELFGIGEVTLRGPFDSEGYRFGLPAEWGLLPGAQVQLDIASFISGKLDPVTGEPLNTFGGSLEIIFNEVTLDTVFFTATGDSTVNVSIPAEALIPTGADGRHELDLIFQSEEMCYVEDLEVSLVVRPTSRLVLPHDFIQLDTDLTQLPRPIFQRDSFFNNGAAIVVPDNPSQQELQAAMIVAASFGRNTNGDLLSTLVPIGQITEPILANAHLIMVGKPGNLSILQQLSLPLPATGGAFAIATGGNADDGVVQMVTSPWNASRVALIVSGNTDVGVVKSAQALASDTLYGSIQKDLAIVAQVNPEANSPFNIETDRTFASLGYPTDTFGGIGLTVRNIDFYIPSGKAIDVSSYLDLVFSHSALLDYARSGMVVKLNGVPIDSARFDDDTAQVSTYRVPIPRSGVRPGLNELRVEVELNPLNICSEFFDSDVWFTLFSESKFHLPLRELTPGLESRVLDLSNFPDFYDNSPSLGGAAFILAPNDGPGWNVGGDIAFYLGDQTDWVLTDMEAYYSSAIPDETRNSRDLILVGRASSQPLLASIRDSLPAPFPEGSDLASQDNLKVEYRVPPGASIGYLELLPAPWNDQLSLLAVLGNSDLGTHWSGAALTTPDLRGQLAGDFAVVNDINIVASNTKEEGVSTNQTFETTTNNVGDVEAINTNFSTEYQRPTWTLVLAAVIFLAILLASLLIFLNSVRNRQP